MLLFGLFPLLGLLLVPVRMAMGLALAAAKLIVQVPASICLAAATLHADVYCWYLGGQPAGAAAQKKLAEYQQLVKQLEWTIGQEKQELQDLKEQLSTTAAMKAMIALKYKHVKSLNAHLQKTIHNIQRTATLAAMDGSKNGKSDSTRWIDPDDASCFSSPGGSPSACNRQQDYISFSNKSQPSFFSARSKSSTTAAAPVTVKSAVTWAMHAALVAALITMRWAGQLMHAANAEMERTVTASSIINYKQLLPINHLWYRAFTWAFLAVYVLWVLRWLRGAYINSMLFCTAMFVTGFCLQAGWLCQRLPYMLAANSHAHSAYMQAHTGLANCMNSAQLVSPGFNNGMPAATY